MAALVACSNFGECRFADGKARWDELMAACPHCSKSLASPHRLQLEPVPLLQEGDACSVSATIEKISGCARPLHLSLELNGRLLGESIPADEKQTSYRFELGSLSRGLYPLRALLETSDGRTTRSQEHALLVGHPPDPFTLWVGALVLILILSLSVGLLWIDQPLFGGATPRWLTFVKDALSFLLPLTIGALFLYLGYRERAFWRAGPNAADAAAWRQRSLIRRQMTDETVPYNIPLARRWLDTGNLWIVLAAVGALPICFLVARLAGRFGYTEWEALTSILAFVFAGLVIAFAFALAGRQNSPAAAPAIQGTASPTEIAPLLLDAAQQPEDAAQPLQDADGEEAVPARTPDEVGTSAIPFTNANGDAQGEGKKA